MQDRPTAPELLDALAAMLFTEVREWVPRERRFQILVAANMAATVARELRAGEEPDRADLALFQRLGAEAADTRGAATELAALIRSGELDAELPAVIDGLREHVARKLEIARPGYTNGPP